MTASACLGRAIFAQVSFCALLAGLVGEIPGDRSDSLPEFSDSLRYARNFSIDRFDGHTELCVRNMWTGAGDAVQSYALVPRDAELPAGLSKEALVVRVPVERIVVMETVFVAMISQLELYDSVAAVASMDLVSDARIHALHQSGEISRIPGSGGLDVETLLTLQPDLILSSSAGGALLDSQHLARRAGLPLAVTASYMEAHPLGRAEWIKFLAEFCGMQAEASEAFGIVERRYRELRARALTARARPRVFANAPFGGVWWVPGGDSYMATLIEDAGAIYVFDDCEGPGGHAIDFELILAAASEAEVWIQPGQHASLDELLAADSRLSGFRAVEQGRVYNSVLRVNDRGGNDFFERGAARPDEVLADLVKVLHPDLLPDHSFLYFVELE